MREWGGGKLPRANLEGAFLHMDDMYVAKGKYERDEQIKNTLIYIP